MSLSLLCDAPRPMPLAGRERAVYRLRVRDALELREWAAAQAGDPDRALLADPEAGSVAWMRRVKAEVDRAASAVWSGGGRDGGLLDDATVAALGTRRGMARELWTILRRGEPGLSWDDACALVAGRDDHPRFDAEAAAIRRHAWAADRLTMLLALLYGPEPRERRPEGGGGDWLKALPAAAERLRCPVPAVLDCTLPMFRAALSDWQTCEAAGGDTGRWDRDERREYAERCRAVDAMLDSESGGDADAEADQGPRAGGGEDTGRSPEPG